MQVGEKQYWYFRETDAPEKPYDRHHAQIYIANFSGPYRRLKELGLITVEVNDHEYRFKDIVDLDTREVLFTVEHEVRSQTHPLYGRPLDQPQPGAEQPQLQARARQHVVGDGMSMTPAGQIRAWPPAARW